MIILYHSNAKIREVVTEENQKIDFNPQLSLAQGVHVIAQQFPDAILVWCHLDCKPNLNLEGIATLFHHHQLMLSFNPEATLFFGSSIGYVEESICINVNKKVTYPTWQMSSAVGVIHASVVVTLKDSISLDTDFDYYLNSLAKLAMPLGLFCYSEPQLLAGSVDLHIPRASVFSLFKFVKQHYKTRWIFLLGLNLILYERQWMILPFLYALFFKRRSLSATNFDSIPVQSSKKVVDTATINVIIPTIGRKVYLYDVLQDLAKQTHLPEKVIIVEQNPLKGSSSELDYLTTESWPFAIKHIFTRQAGACNARNLALAEVESEWVFLNDDDNRLDENLVDNVLAKASQYGATVITTAYLQADEIQQYKTIHQSGIFGSGNSFVKSEFLKTVSFDRVLEFGYGEDTDFGLQLRHQGQDVIYFPDLKITHLKAPIGGFRIKIKKQWESESIQPKPSPTILYVLQKHYTSQQLKSYKLVLFLKLLKHESLSDYLGFYKNFKHKWDRSVYWANKL